MSDSIRLTREEIKEKVLQNIDLMLKRRNIDIRTKKVSLTNAPIYTAFEIENTHKKETLRVMYYQTTWSQALENVESYVDLMSFESTWGNDVSKPNRLLRIILVAKDKPSEQIVRERIQRWKTENAFLCEFEYFSEEFFYADIMAYRYQSRYRVLEPHERVKIYKKFVYNPKHFPSKNGSKVEPSLTEIVSKLPQMALNNTISRYYNLKPGDIVEAISMATNSVDQSFILCTNEIL